jgi:hypothetical protein
MTNAFRILDNLDSCGIDRPERRRDEDRFASRMDYNVPAVFNRY